MQQVSSYIRKKSFKKLYPKQCYYYTTRSAAQSLDKVADVGAPDFVKEEGVATKNVENSTLSSAFTLNPFFVTGFTDAEGSFMVTFARSSESRHGFRVRAVFQIELHEKDLELLKAIQVFFRGIGFIVSTKNNGVAFRARSLDDLKVLIAHFEKYPLTTKKRADFELFKSVVNKLSLKEHLKLQGFQEIVNIRASMNLGLTDALNKAFPETTPVPRPIVKDTNLEINPYWLAGFVSGEGCFFINLSRSASNLIGYQVFLMFSLTQHIRDKKLMETISDYLGCGVKISPSRINVSVLRVVKFPDIVEKIVPFFKKYKVLGVKSEDFNSLCKAAELIQEKKHLTSKGLEEIRQIKSVMNKGRPLPPAE